MGTSPQQFQVKPKQVDIAWDWNKMTNITFDKNPGGLLTLLYKKKTSEMPKWEWSFVIKVKKSWISSTACRLQEK